MMSLRIFIWYSEENTYFMYLMQKRVQFWKCSFCQSIIGYQSVVTYVGGLWYTWLHVLIFHKLYDDTPILQESTELPTLQMAIFHNEPST